MSRFWLILLTLFAAVARPAADASPAPFVQAAEFAYYLSPPTLWERQLVFLKNAGIRTVEIPVPWSWHQLPSGDFDFTGRTN
ncbi:MAG TPA: beta-galactosidase, partial [Bryobacteraceae bacterium]|nr:beta-galactosidase [Bryobacteraceae bacterium]